MQELLKKFGAVGSQVYDKRDMLLCKKLCEASKLALQEKVRSFVQQAASEAMLRSYSADATPKRLHDSCLPMRHEVKKHMRYQGRIALPCDAAGKSAPGKGL